MSSKCQERPAEFRLADCNTEPIFDLSNLKQHFVTSARGDGFILGEFEEISSWRIFFLLFPSLVDSLIGEAALWCKSTTFIARMSTHILLLHSLLL